MLNNHLDLINSKILSAQHELIKEGKYISGKAIKNKFLGIDEYSKKIIEIYQYHNQGVEDLIGIKYQYSTYSKLKTSLMHISNFIQSKYNVDDIALIDLDYQFITSYEHYLRATKGIAINTSNKLFGVPTSLPPNFLCPFSNPILNHTKMICYTPHYQRQCV